MNTVEAARRPEGASLPAPIGVFDSGVGGLTVLRALRARFPGESFIYLGDTARVPYGSKSPETVSRYSLNIASHLMDAGCRAIVVACNTASAYAAGALRDAFDVPIVDVVEPMAAYVAAHAAQHALVLGTRGTVQSGAYPRAIAAHAPQLKVTQRACPLFVPLVEEGWTSGPVPAEIADTYLRDAFQHGVPDYIVLGCTHYPLLREVIAQSAARLAPGAEITIVDSGAPTAEALARALPDTAKHAAGDFGATLRYLVTDAPESFAPFAENFLGERVQHAEHVDILPRY